MSTYILVSISVYLHVSAVFGPHVCKAVQIELWRFRSSFVLESQMVTFSFGGSDQVLEFSRGQTAAVGRCQRAPLVGAVGRIGKRRAFGSHVC